MRIRLYIRIAIAVVGLCAGDIATINAADFALSFDGTNDFVQGMPAGWQTNDGVTVEAWIYRTTRAATSNKNASAVSRSASGPEAWTNPGEWNLGWGWANDAIFRVYAVSNTWPSYLVPNDGDLNQWHHLAGVIDVAAGQVRLYVDGVVRSTATANRLEGTNAIPVWIGRAGNEYTPGKVDEVRLWNKARSAAEIASNWNRRLSGTESNLIAYWRCDSDLTDRSGHGFTGALSNEASFVTSTVPMTNMLTATSTADTGDDSVRAALLSAVNGDTLNITATGAVVLTSGQLSVSNSMTIAGPGPAQLAINGNASNRVFLVTNNVAVSISGLTITNGNALGDPADSIGGGIYNNHSTLTVSNCILSGNSAFQGGAIYSDGGYGGAATLWVIDSVISSNSANAGAIHNFGTYGLATLQVVNSTLSGNIGSAIYNDGRSNNNLGNGILTVSNSTLSGNSAVYGGGIYTIGVHGNVTATIVNSTLSSNTASFYGGAIFQDCHNGGNGTLIISNSTLHGNQATSLGGGIFNDSSNGGNATAQIGSSILNAGSSGANFYSSSPLTSLGFNLASDSGAGYLTATGDLTNTNPQLGPLQNNGGPTKTHALLANSPAIDAGDPSLTSGVDQRGVGYPRVLANYTGAPRADIGAVEAAMTYSLGDGIPDSWRAHYFGGDGSTTNAQSCANCDATATGQNNLFKYVAGLNPTNPASIFNLRIAGSTAPSLIFDPIVAGRAYTPEYRTNLASGVYSNLTGYTGPTTNGDQATITDPNATGQQKFYRIKISLP